MTDILTTPTVPPIIATLVHDYSQKLLTAASVWILAHGATSFVNTLSIANDQTNAQFTDSVIQFGVGLAALGASCAWTYIVAKLRKKKMIELLNFIPKENT